MKVSALQKFVLFAMIGFAVFFAYRMLTSPPPQKTPIAEALTNVHVLGVACREYAAAHGGMYPPSLDVLVPSYLKDRSSLASPLNPSEPDGYIYTAGLKDTGPVNSVFIEDKFASQQHIRIVTFVDGSSRVLNPP